MPCVCDTIPGNLRGYAVDEDRHPLGKSTRHMHIKRRGSRLYRVEWGTDRRGSRFVNVLAGNDADEHFAKDIERWVYRKFDELNVAHDRAVKGLRFSKVKWAI